MKFFYTFILSIFILCALSFSANAQEQAKEKTAPKIAFVDKKVFADEKEGILVYLKALNEVDKEFKPFEEKFKLMAEKIDKISGELKVCGFACCRNEVIEGKQSEIEKLVIAYKSKNESVKVLYEKRRFEILKPIEDEIAKELIEFSKQKGIKYLMDLSGENAFMCCFPPCEPDITKEFIAHYNAKHPVTNSQTQVKLTEPR